MTLADLHARGMRALLACVPGLLALVLFMPVFLRAQQHPEHEEAAPVALQPLAQQVRQVESVLASLGQPLTGPEHEALNRAIGDRDEQQAVRMIGDALAGHVLLDVTINPESRVSVLQGPAAPSLVEGGSRLFLVRIRNQAGVTAP